MKVLILAYDFPPFVSVGGLRPYFWLKHFREFGIDPVVVTRQWSNHYRDGRDYVAPSAATDVIIESNDLGTVIQAPYFPNRSNRLLLSEGPTKNRLIRKALTAWYEIGQYYATIGPKVQLYLAARRYLGEQRVDAVIATAEPFVLFKYAAQLSTEFRIPWVADYRDPWSQDKRRAGMRISRGWEARLERRITASAATITTPAGAVADVLAQLHGGRRVEVVPNGYDQEAMSAARDVAQGREQFTIAFAGSVYGWHPVESVLSVFNEFVGSLPDGSMSLNFVGVVGEAAIESILHRHPKLSRRVTFTPRLPNDQMAVVLAKANVFLMFNNYAYSGTKVFDYLALRRKILLCYSDDPEAQRLKEQHYNLEIAPGADERVLERIVLDTNSGVVVRDAAHLREVLADLSREFKETGSVACEPIGTEKYSRKSSTERLAGLLKGLAQ